VVIDRHNTNTTGTHSGLESGVCTGLGVARALYVVVRDPGVCEEQLVQQGVHTTEQGAAQLSLSHVCAACRGTRKQRQGGVGSKERYVGSQRRAERRKKPRQDSRALLSTFYVVSSTALEQGYTT
jgi:hypothetical protein